MTLAEVQERIEEQAPGPYYAEAYRAAETTYLPRICAWLECLPPGRAVDIGPGWGTMMLWLADHGWRVDVVNLEPVGLWIPPALLADIGAEYVQHDICTGPVPRLKQHSYDLLLMGQVLGHVKYRPDGVLRNVARLLKPDGLAVVHVLDRAHCPCQSATQDWHELPVYPNGEPTEMMNSTQYTRESFSALLDAAGLEHVLWPDDGGPVAVATCRTKEAPDAARHWRLPRGRGH